MEYSSLFHDSHSQRYTVYNVKMMKHDLMYNHNHYYKYFQFDCVENKILEVLHNNKLDKTECIETPLHEMIVHDMIYNQMFDDALIVLIVLMKEMLLLDIVLINIQIH